LSNTGCSILHPLPQVNVGEAMYLLTKQEQETAIRIAKGQEIVATQRGYNLGQRPSVGIPLVFSEVTSTFCPTQRKIYVSRVLGIPTKTSKAMAMGSTEHASISIVFNKVKNAQSEGDEMSQVAEELMAIASTDDSVVATLWAENGLDSIEKYCLDSELSYQDALPEFLSVAKKILLMEATRLRQIATSMTIIPSIAAVEEYIDGFPLGMNRGKIDSLLRLSDGTIMICDMKRNSYGDNLDGKAQIAGYALAMEKEYHVPISVGCLVFSSTLSESGQEPHREIFPIDGNLRSEFVTRRDRAIQIASGMCLPPLPPNAERKCKNCDAVGPCHGIQISRESNR